MGRLLCIFASFLSATDFFFLLFLFLLFLLVLIHRSKARNKSHLTWKNWFRFDCSGYSIWKFVSRFVSRENGAGESRIRRETVAIRLILPCVIWYGKRKKKTAFHYLQRNEEIESKIAQSWSLFKINSQYSMYREIISQRSIKKVSKKIGFDICFWLFTGKYQKTIEKIDFWYLSVIIYREVSKKYQKDRFRYSFLIIYKKVLKKYPKR